MRQHKSSPLSTLTFLSLLLRHAVPSAAITFDCSNIRQDKVSWNLEALGGRRSVSHIDANEYGITNTTFTVDICKSFEEVPNIDDKAVKCPSGSRVCAVERWKKKESDTEWDVHNVIGIAGDYSVVTGRPLDPKIERLKGGSSHEDSEREGLRVTLGGGKNPDKKSGKDQKAIIEFVCDKSRTGTEDWEGKAVTKSSFMRREEGDKKEDGDKDGDEGEGEEEDPDKDRSLRFISYKSESTGNSDADVLRLVWRTQYACENADPPEKPAGSGGLGFFGWFFLVLFLGGIGYLAVGAYINYSRYGAQGWDLVPHGDTIRDLPYIFKDWIRSVIDSVQGRAASRGGYSAV